jgi:hypothetical protein
MYAVVKRPLFGTKQKIFCPGGNLAELKNLFNIKEMEAQPVFPRRYKLVNYFSSGIMPPACSRSYTIYSRKK